MAYKFLDIVATPSVQAAQAANGSRQMWEHFKGHRTFDRFTENESAFIEARDSFYIASVSESGWPYVQHRGGPPGFIKVLDDKTLAFPDFRGNLQYISLGNVAADDRVALIMVDYPNRARLKFWRTWKFGILLPTPSSQPGWRYPATRRRSNERLSCTSKRSTGIVRSTSRRVTRNPTSQPRWLR